MSKWTLTLLIFVFSSAALAEDATFAQGLTAFQNKEYDKARELFEKSAIASPHEASILHNWALTELQLGKKGSALALWRKALSVDPDFLPARKGRDYIESRFQMRAFEKDPWDRTFNRTLERFSFDELLGGVALLLGVTGWLWLRFIARRRHAYEEMTENPPFPTVATLFTIGLSILTTVLALKSSAQFSTRATVVAERTSAKSLPNDQGAALYDLSEGSEVLVKRKQENWLQVTNSDGLTGWVPESMIQITSGW